MGDYGKSLRGVKNTYVIIARLLQLSPVEFIATDTTLPRTPIFRQARIFGRHGHDQAPQAIHVNAPYSPLLRLRGVQKERPKKTMPQTLMPAM